jgi:hypothetical protein
MKHSMLVFLLFITAIPALASKKVTVGQLEDLLRTMQQDKKTDVEVASALKQLELAEELTRSAMNNLMRLVPGPRTTEQIYIFEAQSADLIPPASDLPATPAPDAAAQKAIFDKAAVYIANTCEKLPPFTATRTTLRFQDNFEAVSSSSGISGSAKDVVTTSGFSSLAAFIHYINSTQERVSVLHGAAQLSTETSKVQWGANKMIAMREPDPTLSVVFKQAKDSGTIKWLRWELINGKAAAVYSFTADNKNSGLALNVCCFPNVKQAGIATFYTATTAGVLGGGGGGGGGGVAGNFQTSTDWHNYKTTAPYHGEFFIDPETGVVVRMITEADLQSSEIVHQVDTRIDYAPTSIAGKISVVPVKTIVNTEVVPNGDSGAGGYKTRSTLFTSQFSNYQLAGSK